MALKISKGIALALAFFVGGCALVPAAGQDAPPTAGEPSYLLRLERMLPEENRCVLLRGDGQFHFEREFRDSMEIFEGTLALPDLQTVEQLVNSDEIFQLSQEKIATPLIGFPDEMILSIARPGHWQNLRFPTPDTRKPFRQSLDPLLKWMDSLHAQKQVTLTEDGGRNNCLPPGKIEFSARPTAGANNQPSTVAPAAASAPPTAAGSSPAYASETPAFAMRFMESHFENRQVENSCLIVYPTGRYRRERKTQKIGSPSVATQIYEDSLKPAELQQLRDILDDSKLQQRSFKEPPPRLAALEMDYVTLTIARSDHNQNLNFWKYFGAYRTGSAGMPMSDDNGMKLLKPLNHWLKTLYDSPASPVSDPKPNNCAVDRSTLR